MKLETTKSQWLDQCLRAAHEKASFYSGARKIIRPYRLVFTVLDNSLQLSDTGFTRSKLKMLVRNYLHEESRRVAEDLWLKRRRQEKYGSVGFSCYKVLVKGDVKGATPRGSVFGPCLQSVVISWIDKEHYSIDVFYRTTEMFKKFGPDIVFLRDILLQPFYFDKMRLHHLTYHFANITAHPMYFVTLVPFIDPVKEISSIKDDYFRRWIIKWTARYTCPEYNHGIQKFAQAMRVAKDANERIDKVKLRALQSYLRANHPGYTRTRFEEEEDDEAGMV